VVGHDFFSGRRVCNIPGVQLLGKARRGCLLVVLGFAALLVASEASAAPESPPAAAQAGAPVGKVSPALLEKADELWKKRDDPAAVAQMKTLVDRGLAEAPNDYAILWRAAAWHFWVSDDPQRSRDDKIKFGKAGWDLGERAVAANPQGVEGHFFAMATMGNYSLGIGILRALTQRIEGKFTTRLHEAERLDPRFANGGVWVAWGRYHATLPWPKYDAKKALAAFQHALEVNPNNLRARVFLADLLIEEDQPQQAKKLLDEVIASPGNRYDPPEEKRAKFLATGLLPKANEALKK
jgi:hypothetical protein